MGVDKNPSGQKDSSVINDAEIVETLGNCLLVRINGEIEQVSNTYKNELLYKHKLYELLHPGTIDERVVLTSEESEDFIAVAPTENDSVYQIWIDDNPYPVMNPPSMAEEVLKGVKEAVESPPRYDRLHKVYQEIRSSRVRRHVIEKVAGMFPKSEVIPEEDGWNILGVFLLSWDARVFLNTGDIEEKKSYRVSGTGVSETDEAKEFLQLSISDNKISSYRGQKVQVRYPLSPEVKVENRNIVDNNCPNCGESESYRLEHEENSREKYENKGRPVYVCTDESCRLAWEEYRLTEREIEFISKANWLLNHREKLDDDAFWDVVESYVWHSQTNTQS